MTHDRKRKSCLVYCLIKSAKTSQEKFTRAKIASKMKSKVNVIS